jgi:hypothetical protein
MKNIFFINHALRVDNRLSVFNDDQRFEQTLQTINSINKYCPNNFKFIFDSSPNMVYDAHLDTLKSLGVSVFSFGDNETVRKFSLSGMRSLSETITFMTFLDLFKTLNIVGGRIYKLSGRYELNDNFDSDYQKYKNSFVFTKAEDSWMGPDKIESSGVSKLFKLRLWHMDFSLLPVFREKLQLILNDCMKYGIDIEHSYYKHLHSERVIEVDKIGVQGFIAPNGSPINE